MKHLTVRFAWHDGKWNGKVCRNPSENIYCVDNYSLLSSRIQRRRKVEIEEKFRGCDISEIKNEANYTPPCYWCINALGSKECLIEDAHPFADTWDKFRVVPPIKEIIKPYSVFTWNFNLSFNAPGNYIHPPDLENRVKKYIDEIKPRQSIVFFYANYGNPITGDERKYLLLGAGLVREKPQFPKSYNFPQKLYDEMNKKRPVFPKIAWQLQIPLDPETTFILPYHEYLEWIEQNDSIERDEKEKYLDTVAVRIDDSTIIPHFKYVSMHLPHDKAIYLLYKLKKAVKEMKGHGVVSIEQINDIERKIDKLLNIAWKERGKYPGFKNLLEVLLKNDFEESMLEGIIDEVMSCLIRNFGSVEEFLQNKNNKKLIVKDDKLRRAIDVIERQFELLEFLSRFDFSREQFKNVINLIGEKGLHAFKSNPYLLLEDYPYDIKDDDWDIENNDYGISVYQLDIALIPDPEYTDWETLYDSRSLERVRALITKILKDAAQNEGHTYLAREEILKRIMDYPLYYIQRKFEVDKLLLKNYENETRFKELFKITNVEDKVVYQLKSLEKIEKIIERFIKTLENKKHDVNPSDVESLVEKDLKVFRDKLQEQNVSEQFRKERFDLYTKALSNGLTVISGKAGSGKTSAIINLIQKFKSLRKTPIFIFTPTGKASLVIRKRLKELKLHNDPGIKISTIHWFIYGALLDIGKNLPWTSLEEIFKLVELASKIFDGHYELIDDFERKARRWQFNPQVVIIDEASMVDEITFSLLFSLINPALVRHLIIIGDDKQLPPIGVGRPFIDILYYLKNRGLENNYQHLTVNLRFPSRNGYAKIERLAELFRSEKEPLPSEVDSIISSSDNTFEIKYFNDINELKEILREILLNVSGQNNNKSLRELFIDIFEPREQFDYENLEKVQIIAPKRVGKFGTLMINRNVILEKEKQDVILPGTKIICEENQYWKIKGKRMLALANGSIGYITTKKDTLNLQTSMNCLNYTEETIRLPLK